MRPQEETKKLSNGPLLKKEKRVKYKECRKNHAANIGGYAVDGCREFMAAGEEGTSAALKCAACSCHRNFHRRETETDGTGIPNSSLPQRLLTSESHSSRHEQHVNPEGQSPPARGVCPQTETQASKSVVVHLQSPKTKSQTGQG
ncbi:hypothetical protein HHK36_017003 [Tetracentron sinense]|uniref:ZF-HD dimerization-type domain-containing protein n=1 Tax=Tetracentron sinense TaxID=13715 RepID=A0A834Z6C6_TETSI|nr:hypothetical protein HHK36_017003 [Tetracentron sinense]